MKNLLIKMTSNYPHLESFFHRYTLLFNEYYRHRTNRAYFETIDKGFLYILPDLETFHRIAESVPNQQAIRRLLQANQSERATLAKELIEDLNFSPKEKILLHIEVSPYSINDTMPFMKKIFLAINSEITFTPLDEHDYTIQFPHLDAFIDYYTVFLLSIRHPNQE